MKIKFNSKELSIEVVEKKGLGLIRGLMFRRRERAPILLFNLNSSLHSFFVFFPFMVLWLDNEDNVVDYKIVKPWRFNIKTDKNYVKIVEIPFSRRYSEYVKFVVGLKGLSTGKGLKREVPINYYNLVKRR